MKRYFKFASVCFALAVAPMGFAQRPTPPPGPGPVKGLAVVYPFGFDGGTKTSRETAIRSLNEVMQKSGFATVGDDTARQAWGGSGRDDFLRYPEHPSEPDLQAFGQRLHANLVVFGRIYWHTRSIWVDLGPKTISTADTDVYILDVASGHIVYKREHVDGRSDEPENAWKAAGDVLISPLFTAVSGGPATPREQRAVQISVGKALRPWVHGER